MAARRGAVASALGSPGRHAAKRVRIRGRRWTVTFNDRLEYPPSERWREEAENRRGRQEDVDRASCRRPVLRSSCGRRGT